MVASRLRTAREAGHGSRAGRTAVALLALCATMMLAAVWHDRMRMAGRHGAALLRSLVPLAGWLHGGMPAVAAGPVLPTQIGITPTAVLWYDSDQPFANLVVGAEWQHATPGGWIALPSGYADRDGTLHAVPAGGDVVRMLVRPDTGAGGVTIRCTYQGQAELSVNGTNISNLRTMQNGLSFRWINRWANDSLWVQVHSIAPGAPLRQLDCRTAGTPPTAIFNPAYVTGLKGYKVLRFMDWERTNANEPSVTWPARHLPGAIDYTTGDGVPVEQMVALANLVGSDAWFSIPWNADDDYVQHFAAMVHDRLNAGHKAYVEVGNEVWNQSFPVARQASDEGRRAGLSANAQEAQQRRYAQRAIQVMKIWERAFADAPRRLVRVVSTQDANPHVAEMVFAAPGLADHVDALATAPYFGLDLMREGQTSDLDEIFRRLGLRVDAALDGALRNEAIAARYRKRYITYEAGQHVVIPTDAHLEELIERDPRIHDLYRRYIDGWRRRVGDTLMMFGTVGPIGTNGAWGMVEHIGQPAADAPKLRAMQEELAIR